MKFRLIEDYLIETIADVKKYYPTIKDNDFNRIIALDPTFDKTKDKVGTYGKWLLNLFKKNKLENEGHVKDLLTRFEEKRKQLKNKDIMSYKSIEEVEDALNDESSYNALSARQELRQTQNAIRKTDINKDAELVYEDSDWEIWVPKTYEASCKLGQGTSWCTASTSSNYYYDSYIKDGPLYININKNNGEKYQFHFPSLQFMDADDRSIDLEEFMSDNPTLSSFYDKLATERVNELIDNNELPYYVLQPNVYLSENELVEYLKPSDFRNDFFEGLLRGDVWEFFANSGYEEAVDDNAIEYTIRHDLDDRNKELLLSKGFNPEDSSTWSPDLEDTLFRAVVEGYEIGSSNAAIIDFDRSLEKAFNEVLNKGDTYERDYEDGSITIIRANIDDSKSKYYWLQNGQEDPADEYLEKLSDNFTFYEPQYGWYEFEPEAFNQVLYDFQDEF